MQSYNTLDYKNYGQYTKDNQKKRDVKFDEKQAAKRGFLSLESTQADCKNHIMSISNFPRSRGRKPIYIKQQE